MDRAPKTNWISGQKHLSYPNYNIGYLDAFNRHINVCFGPISEAQVKLMSIRYCESSPLSDYLEAVGIMQMLKEGIALDTVTRPISHTRILK